jgi:hypothetical protein
MVLGFLSRQDEDRLMPAIIEQSKCRVLEGSAGELHWATCLEIIGTGGIQSRAPSFF